MQVALATLTSSCAATAAQCTCTERCSEQRQHQTVLPPLTKVRLEYLPHKEEEPLLGQPTPVQPGLPCKGHLDLLLQIMALHDQLKEGRGGQGTRGGEGRERGERSSTQPTCLHTVTSKCQKHCLPAFHCQPQQFIVGPQQFIASPSSSVLAPSSSLPAPAVQCWPPAVHCQPQQFSAGPSSSVPAQAVQCWPPAVQFWWCPWLCSLPQ